VASNSASPIPFKVLQCICNTLYSKCRGD